MANYIMGMEPESVPVRRTQVYLATHDGGGNRLPFMNRSFISFTYGGVAIEDFNLIAIVENNRMQRKLYGAFNDNTTNSDVLDGTTYWSTYFVNNELTFNLATDEMTEEQLNAFKHLFQPGPPKELILAETPNRAIMARVKAPPEYQMLPFEKKVTKKFRSASDNTVVNEYETSTTVYRGAIELQLVADDPFWYSVHNILPSYSYDTQNRWTYALSNPDMLKVIVEDGVPIREMFTDTNSVITGEGRLNVSEGPIVGGTDKDGASYVGARTGGLDSQGTLHVGAKLRTIIVTLTSGSESNDMYLFYAGTAPAPTIINFTLTPEVDMQYKPHYITRPGNSIYQKASVGNGVYIPYNELKVGNKTFKFSTPSIYTGYNQAQQIVQSLTNGISTVDVKLLLNDGIKEYYSRAWALGTLNYIISLNPNDCLTDALMIQSIEDFQDVFQETMLHFLGEVNITTDEETYEVTKTIITEPAIFSFNSKTGQAIGTFTIPVFKEDADFSIHGVPLETFFNKITVVENVGDMVKSEYLYLTERNYATEDGLIPPENCSKITTNYPGGLTNFDIQYKHTYL